MVIERYLLIWLCMISIVAFNCQTWFGVDPFSASTPYLLYVIAITMLAIGWLLPKDEVEQVIRRWPAVLAGTSIQYTSMPILAFAIGRLFQLNDDAMVGIVMVGCVPGAMASNVLTLLAKGNVSYSVSLTTAATLLSPVVVPIALYLALGQSRRLNALNIATKLLVTVVGPVIIGHLLSRRNRSNREFTNRIAVAVANLAILWIIAAVVAKNRTTLGLTSGIIVLALLCLNLGGYATGLLAGAIMRIPTGMRRALTLEIGMQNAGIGTALAAVLFSDRPAVTIPTAIYTFGCMFTGTILAKMWSVFDSVTEDSPSD